MREVMIRLSGFLRRHRRAVVVAWAVIFLLAFPFAARQTEHLTGGGFDVPGSQSKAVTESLERDFGAQLRRDRRRRCGPSPAPGPRPERRRSPASAARSPKSTR